MSDEQQPEVRAYDIRVNAEIEPYGLGQRLKITGSLGEAEIEFRFPGEAGEDAEVLAEAAVDLLLSTKAQLQAAAAAETEDED